MGSQTPRSRTASLRKTFDAPRGITAAEITGVADFCRCRIFINGRRIAEVEDHSPKFRFDVFRHLKPGRNMILLQANSHSGPPAVAMRLRLTQRDGSETFVTTNKTWQGTRSAAVESGVLASEPWGDHPDSITINALDDYTQWKQATGAARFQENTSPFEWYASLSACGIRRDWGSSHVNRPRLPLLGNRWFSA